jgi:hypothetical protein
MDVALNPRAANASFTIILQRLLTMYLIISYYFKALASGYSLVTVRVSVSQLILALPIDGSWM